MKLLLYSDVHWSEFSSIIRTHGLKYSTRLEYLIKSMNWVESLASTLCCDATICLGDFFDKPQLNAKEISALKEIIWGKHPHYFIVGNHEIASSNMEINSANLFQLLPTSIVIDKPTLLFGNVFVLPYILNHNRKNLSEYLQDKPDIILSHNDIAGILMGLFISKDGFTLDEIRENCNLFINGHIHNLELIDDYIFNIGNLCGLNFSEDAFKYSHLVWIVDTVNRTIDKYDNPYAFNFYKLDFSLNNSIDYINDISSKIKHNSVLSVKCNDNDYNYLKARFGAEDNDLIPKNCNVLLSRFIVNYINSYNEDSQLNNELLVDHLKLFDLYIRSNFEKDDILIEELLKVLT